MTLDRKEMMTDNSEQKGGELMKNLNQKLWIRLTSVKLRKAKRSASCLYARK